jgi:LysR family transcriptional regulator, cyn operon transcriptional activator
MFGMELRHLRYFVSVAESGSVSKAADRVRISQPALSRQIHDLESELKVALFEPSGRRLRLTGAGEDLLAYGRRVLNEAEAFRERARVLHRGDAGVLHVGATPQSLQHLFPVLLHRFRKALPAVDVRLTEGHSASLLNLIRQGALHLAFTTYEPEFRDGCRLVGMMPLLAIGNSERLGQGHTVEVRALEDVPLLLVQRGSAVRDLFDAACRVAHIRQTIFLESNAPATVLSLARAGCGVAILSRAAILTASIDLRGRGLTVQSLVQEGVPLEFRVAVHWNPQRFLPPYAKRFAEEFSEYAAQEYGRIAALWDGRRGSRPSRRKR